MIEASSSSLGEFLKNKGVETAVSAITETPVNPVNPINTAVTNTTDSLEKFTNLLESVNKLLNSPLISGVMQKGVERKTTNKEEVIDLPEGFNPPNQTTETKPLKPIKEKNKDEIINNLFDALFSTIQEMSKQKPDRTIKEIFTELNQEIIKEEIKKQIEVLI